MQEANEITFELTHFCEHGCSFCSSNASSDINKAVFMKYVTIKKMLKGKWFGRINLSGGEPLAHPLFYQIHKLCEQHTDDVMVYSNLITHRAYNGRVIDGVYLDCFLTVLPEVDKIHILRRIKQGKEANRPEVHRSRNFRMDCACDHRVVLPNGDIVMTPCNKFTKVTDPMRPHTKKIYVVGSHGVGKTTLIKDAESSLRIPFYENNSQNPYTDDIKRRQLWRLYKYKTDEEMLKTCDSENILINRCCFDWLIYTETFKKLKWISQEDYHFLIDQYTILFENQIPDNILYLNPPIEWSKERIRERWNEGGKKWREENFEYYEVLRDKYNKVMSKLSQLTNVLEITDIRKNNRIKAIKSIV